MNERNSSKPNIKKIVREWERKKVKWLLCIMAWWNRTQKKKIFFSSSISIYLFLLAIPWTEAFWVSSWEVFCFILIKMIYVPKTEWHTALEFQDIEPQRQRERDEWVNANDVVKNNIIILFKVSWCSQKWIKNNF
jgi:hypothetical protein